MKRPFMTCEESLRSEMTKLVSKLGSDNSIIEPETIRKKEDYFDYKKCIFKCPCCNRINSWKKFSSYNWNNKDIFDYETAYGHIIPHIKSMVLLYGDEAHMKFVIDFFGKEKGIYILNLWAVRNILIAKKISEFVGELK